jgi:hypothetical protein
VSLYPITYLDAATAVLQNTLMPSGALVVIPIDMLTVQMTQINMAQLALTQDYSLRTWVSLDPDGLAIERYFPILRTGGVPFVIYIAGFTPPTNTYSILVAPGNYFLNILNLTNEQNVLAFSQIDLALSPSIVGGSGVGLTNIAVGGRIPSTFVGCSSTGQAGRPLIAVAAPLVGGLSTGHAGTVLTSRSLPVVGAAATGHAGTPLVSLAHPSIGCSGTGNVGTLSVMTLGFRLTPSKKLWQALRRQ